jgi:hypothetical protein
MLIIWKDYKILIVIRFSRTGGTPRPHVCAAGTALLQCSSVPRSRQVELLEILT